MVSLTTDKVYGTFITKLSPNHYQYEVGSFRNVTRNGINYKLDISDIMSWYIYFGFIEEAKQNLYSLIEPSNIVFDVGANLGETTLNFAKLIGSKGKVYSFEPDPINYKALQTNLKLNNFNNISLNLIGLGNTKGKFKIHTLDESNKGMNRIVLTPESNGEYREIEVTTIDTYTKDNNITKLDLIKIDVEGFEFNVLKGATNSLKMFSPKLFIELDDQNLRDQKSNAQELVSFLMGYGYEIKNAETNQKINTQTNFTNCHYDIIAVKSTVNV